MVTILQKNIDSYTIVGVMEITETEERYLSHLNLSDDEKRRFEKHRSPLRRLQWLSYRVLLKQLTGENLYKGVSYSIHGKPQLKGLPYYISVAHTGKYSAVIVSKNCSVGIDIEPIGEKITRVEKKFLSEEELAFIPATSGRQKALHIIWGFKESVYKYYGEGELIFAEDIGVKPFIANDKGEIEGFLKAKDKTTEYFTGFYEIIKGMVLVSVLPKTCSVH